jgi:hypothetical protein
MAAARSRRLTAAVAAAVAVVAFIMTLAIWRYWPWREKYTVAMPPPAASQQTVVRAYLRALDAHDSATALALSDRSMRSTTRMWLAKTAGVSRIKIGAVQYAASEQPGEQYSVPTDFVYASHWWADDPSFGDGEHYWEYWLIKINGRWLINDEGTG